VTKGEQTREDIILKAVDVFNTKGYAASSISDIMAATGLQKGGIYNHFSSKEELSLAAFEHASGIVGQRMTDAIRSESNAVAKLVALITTFRMHVENPPFRGGCAVLNAAVESDYANPEFREHVCKVMDELRSLIIYVVNEGIKRRQIKPSVNSDYCATVFIATMEGGVMLSSLYRDSMYIDYSIHHLTEYIQTQLAL
jgi:AcrR family transcriptional regulator